MNNGNRETVTPAYNNNLKRSDVTTDSSLVKINVARLAVMVQIQVGNTLVQSKQKEINGDKNS